MGEAVSTWSDLQRPGFDPGPVCVLAAVMNLTLSILFPFEVLLFSSVSFNSCPCSFKTQNDV